MKLSELLSAIEEVANDKGLSKPYIVGGLVRDKILNRIDTINDVDITTGDQSIRFLAAEIAERLQKHPRFSYNVMTDGHVKIEIENFSLDFSSNFKTPGIERILQEAGIEDLTEMQKELYSRDFTCNAALMTLDFKKILDPTGLAIRDIKKGVVRTLLPPNLTLGYDNNRIVRTIYIAAKLGFEVDPKVKEWIKEHPELITNSKPNYIGKKLKKAAEFSPEIAANLLSELGLWKYIPLVPDLIDYQKKALVTKAAKKKKRVDLDVRPYPNPLFKNYDYGGPEEGSETSPGRGLYNGKMDKYKSTKEFIEKSRKRKNRRKALLNIFNSLNKKASYYDEDIDEKILDLGERNPRPFNSWFGGQDRVYIPFDMPSNNEDYSGGEEDVIKVLKEYYPDKCQEIDFIGGYCLSGNNKQRIGKLLNSLRNKNIKEITQKMQEFQDSYEQETDISLDPEYMALEREYQKMIDYWKDIIGSFTDSPIRARKNESNKASHKIAFSQDPLDIAYMSTGRNWESCMTLPVGGQHPGSHHSDVFCEVKEGGFIAYLIRADDTNISDPIARIRIRRFENEQGDSYAIPESSVYGEDVAGFSEAVKSWVDKNQKAIPGVYKRKGGQYSDTFGTSKVISPEEEENLIEWMTKPDDHGAKLKYWVVVDNLRDDLDDEFETDGILGGLQGDHPTEKTFFNEEEANRYKEIISHSETEYHIDEILRRECEEEFRHHHSIYGDGETMTSDEIEDAIDDNKYFENCQYSKYLDNDYERFTIEENVDDRTGIMQRAVTVKVLDNPKRYSKKLIDLVKNHLFTDSEFGDANLKSRFVNEFHDQYENLSTDIEKDPTNKSIKLLSKYHENLRDGGEKERVGEVLKGYIKEAFDEDFKKAFNDGMNWEHYMWYKDRLELLQSFKPIPEDLTSESIDFINMVNEMPTDLGRSGLENSHKVALNKHLIHQFAMTGTDTPSVQRYYESLLPEFEPLQKKTTRQRIRDGSEKSYSLDDLGWSLAKLGENGKQFLPFLKQKVKEVIDYVPQEGEMLFDKDENRIKQTKKTVLERLMYIIDSIETGQGHSTKFRFHNLGQR